MKKKMFSRNSGEAQMFVPLLLPPPDAHDALLSFLQFKMLPTSKELYI
jgi:hypothetical protein